MHSTLEGTRPAGIARQSSPDAPARHAPATASTPPKAAHRGVTAPTTHPDAVPTPDVGIIILNYNTVDLLRDCLHSLLRDPAGMAGTGVDGAGARPAVACEMVVCVVDNASTDGSTAMVRAEFPEVRLLVNAANVGYSAGNNVGLRWLGFDPTVSVAHPCPRYALLLNPDTVVPPGALDAMVAYMDAQPQIGVAGPRVRRPDGALDLACRRSFPTPTVSAYRISGLSRLFPKSRRFNAYNLAYMPEDAVHPVDSVVGAFMLVRAAAIATAGLLDERFFMYGEDLDWAKRIKDAGWQVWYNGQVEIVHVKEAASRQSSKARIDFYEAMWLFYQKHYRATTPRWLEMLILLGIVASGSLDIARHLWRFGRSRPPVGRKLGKP
ncbi:MAG: glycosyltransferase family 2 protein [Litorilinea sp.]